MAGTSGAFHQARGGAGSEDGGSQQPAAGRNPDEALISQVVARVRTADQAPTSSGVTHSAFHADEQGNRLPYNPQNGEVRSADIQSWPKHIIPHHIYNQVMSRLGTDEKGQALKPTPVRVGGIGASLPSRLREPARVKDRDRSIGKPDSTGAALWEKGLTKRAIFGRSGVAAGTGVMPEIGESSEETKPFVTPTNELGGRISIFQPQGNEISLSEKYDDPEKRAKQLELIKADNERRVDAKQRQFESLNRGRRKTPEMLAAHQAEIDAIRANTAPRGQGKGLTIDSSPATPEQEQQRSVREQQRAENAERTSAQNEEIVQGMTGRGSSRNGTFRGAFETLKDAEAAQREARRQRAEEAPERDMSVHSNWEAHVPQDIIIDRTRPFFQGGLPYHPRTGFPLPSDRSHEDWEGLEGHIPTKPYAVDGTKYHPTKYTALPEDQSSPQWRGLEGYKSPKTASKKSGKDLLHFDEISGYSLPHTRHTGKKRNKLTPEQEAENAAAEPYLADAQKNWVKKQATPNSFTAVNTEREPEKPSLASELANTDSGALYQSPLKTLTEVHGAAQRLAAHIRSITHTPAAATADNTVTDGRGQQVGKILDANGEWTASPTLAYGAPEVHKHIQTQAARLVKTMAALDRIKGYLGQQHLPRVALDFSDSPTPGGVRATQQKIVSGREAGEFARKELVKHIATIKDIHQQLSYGGGDELSVKGEKPVNKYVHVADAVGRAPSPLNLDETEKIAKRDAKVKFNRAGKVSERTQTVKTNPIPASIVHAADLGPKIKVETSQDANGKTMYKITHVPTGVDLNGSEDTFNLADEGMKEKLNIARKMIKEGHPDFSGVPKDIIREFIKRSKGLSTSRLRGREKGLPMDIDGQRSGTGAESEEQVQWRTGESAPETVQATPVPVVNRGVHVASLGKESPNVTQSGIGRKAEDVEIEAPEKPVEERDEDAIKKQLEKEQSIRWDQRQAGFRPEPVPSGGPRSIGQIPKTRDELAATMSGDITPATAERSAVAKGAKKPAAKKSTAKKPAEKKPAAKKPAAKKTTKGQRITKAIDATKAPSPTPQTHPEFFKK
jgi:hypothetical protein